MVKQSPGFIVPYSVLPGCQLRIDQLELTVVDNVRVLMEALADTVSTELLVHTESVPLGKLPVRQRLLSSRKLTRWSCQSR